MDMTYIIIYLQLKSWDLVTPLPYTLANMVVIVQVLQYPRHIIHSKNLSWFFPSYPPVNLSTTMIHKQETGRGKLCSLIPTKSSYGCRSNRTAACGQQSTCIVSSLESLEAESGSIWL